MGEEDLDTADVGVWLRSDLGAMDARERSRPQGEGDLDVSGVDEWLQVGPGRANVGEQPQNNLRVEKGEWPRVENRGSGENASDVREGPGVVGVNVGESTEEERYRRLLLDFDFNWGSRDTGVTIEEHSMDC